METNVLANKNLTSNADIMLALENLKFSVPVLLTDVAEKPLLKSYIEDFTPLVYEEFEDFAKAIMRNGLVKKMEQSDSFSAFNLSILFFTQKTFATPFYDSCLTILDQLYRVSLNKMENNANAENQLKAFRQNLNKLTDFLHILLHNESLQNFLFEKTIGKKEFETFLFNFINFEEYKSFIPEDSENIFEIS